jgi:outer membrane protein TolC
LEAIVKKNVVTAAALVLASILPVAAQTTATVQPQTPPAGQTPLAPVPGIKPSATFQTPGPRVDLTIEDAVARGRDKNIDIAVARVTPRLSDFSIAALEANYAYNLTSTGSASHVESANTNATSGVAAGTNTVRNTTAWNGGIAKNMFRGGGNFAVTFNNNRLANPSANAFRNPQFNSSFGFNYVQPLLRGFKTDSTRAALQTTRISQQNDEISLQTTVASTDANVRNAYWDLVYAIQAVEAAQNSLDIANKLVTDNRSRVEIGTLAPLDVRTSEAEAANTRLTLVQAQATVRTSELALKRLIVSGTDDPVWSSSINPTDRPPTTPEVLNVDAAIARALSQRTDLQQSKNNLKISDINLQNQVDLTKPQLNVTANYGLAGLGGPYTPSVRDPITGIVVPQPTVPSGYLDSLGNLFGFNIPQFTLTFNFAYPLGRSAQQANVARSKLSLEQSQANLKALQLQIATDVQNAALNVQSSLESVQAAQVARQLAQEKLSATQSKLDVGMSTNYEVVQAQRDFFDAQNAELRAVANYRKAIVNYETAQTVGTRAVGSTVGSGTGGTGTTTTNTGGTTGGGGGGGGSL